MRLSGEKVRSLSRRRGLSLSAALELAGVSRTAYYSLLRRPSVLPGTVRALAAALGVAPEEILVEERVIARLREARAVCATEPGASFENVWHALCLLDLPPLERLNRSLIRGRATAVH